MTMFFGDGEEVFPNARSHPRSPDIDSVETSIAIALDPPPPAGGYASGDRVVLRTAAAYDPTFKWWSLGMVLEQFTVLLIRADEPEGWPLSILGEDLIAAHPLPPKPPDPSASPSVHVSYRNQILHDGGDPERTRAPGRYWVMGTVDGRRSKPIHFRIRPPGAGSGEADVLDTGRASSVRVEPLGTRRFAAGAPILLRGRVDAGPRLLIKSRAHPASAVLLIVVQVKHAFEPPDDWDGGLPVAGDLVNDAWSWRLPLADAVGAKVSTDRFEVDVAAAAKLKGPGTYWAMATVDGALSEAVEFEIA